MDIRTYSAKTRAAGYQAVGSHSSSRSWWTAVSWNTSIWRDKKTNSGRLAVPARVRGRKGSGDAVRVEFTFDPEDDDA